jgi:hypothetical protein
MTSSQCICEVRPCKDHRGADLISDALPLRRLWYAEPNAASNAVDYAKFYSRSHRAVIRVYNKADNVIETHEHAGDVSDIDKLACACRAAELMARFMNYRMLTVAVALVAVRVVVPFASAESKAPDTFFYKGKVTGLRIVFEFDHGHVEDSNVKITESASGKTTKFYLSGRDGQTGTGKIRFAPVKGAKKEVLLEIDPFGDPPSTVKGSYTAAGKTVPFALRKRKKH